MKEAKQTNYKSPPFLCVCVVRLHDEEEEEGDPEEKKLLAHKHDIISVLGVGGHWVTSHQDLQVSWSCAQKPRHSNNFIVYYLYSPVSKNLINGNVENMTNMEMFIQIKSLF